MAPRRLLGCLAAAALAAGAWAGCGDDKPNAKPGAVLDSARCQKLAKSCSDEKHEDKLVGECVKAADKLGPRGCNEAAVALYDCYEQKLCGKSDKVWTLDDLRVLAERHEVCDSERKALRACVTK
jgi:hypothetical protein